MASRDTSLNQFNNRDMSQNHGVTGVEETPWVAEDRAGVNGRIQARNPQFSHIILVQGHSRDGDSRESSVGPTANRLMNQRIISHSPDVTVEQANNDFSDSLTRMSVSKRIDFFTSLSVKPFTEPSQVKRGKLDKSIKSDLLEETGNYSSPDKVDSIPTILIKSTANEGIQSSSNSPRTSLSETSTPVFKFRGRSSVTSASKTHEDNSGLTEPTIPYKPRSCITCRKISPTVRNTKPNSDVLLASAITRYSISKSKSSHEEFPIRKIPSKEDVPPPCWTLSSGTSSTVLPGSAAVLSSQSVPDEAQRQVLSSRVAPSATSVHISAGRNSVSASSAPICRICHDTDSAETLIAPCLCAGSMGLLHRSCVERWLATANRSSCEICGHKFTTRRVTLGFCEWLRKPTKSSDRRNLIADVTCFLLLTPLAIVGVWLGMTGYTYYAGLAGLRWEAVGLLALSLFLIASYFIWFIMAIRYHRHVFHDWQKVNQIVHLVHAGRSRSSRRSRSRRRSRSEARRQAGVTEGANPPTDSAQNAQESNQQSTLRPVGDSSPSVIAFVVPENGSTDDVTRQNATGDLREVNVISDVTRSNTTADVRERYVTYSLPIMNVNDVREYDFTNDNRQHDVTSVIIQPSRNNTAASGPSHNDVRGHYTASDVTDNYVISDVRVHYNDVIHQFMTASPPDDYVRNDVSTRPYVVNDVGSREDGVEGNVQGAELTTRHGSVVSEARHQ